MLVAITLIVSFCLDGIVSNFIPIHSQLLIPLLTLMSLLIIYPYFNHHEDDYLKVAGVLGLCYDIVFTDTVFLHCVLFLLVALFIRLLNEWFSNNIVSIGFMAVLVIAFDRILEYSILSLVGFFAFDGMYLLQGIYSSILLNVIYAILLYVVTDKISRKFHIRKIE